MLTGSLIKFCIHYAYLLLIIIFIIHCHKGSITIIHGYIYRRQIPSTRNAKSKFKLFRNKSEQEESLCKCVKYGSPLALMPFLLHLDCLFFFLQVFFHLFSFVTLIVDFLSCHIYFANRCSG